MRHVPSMGTTGLDVRAVRAILDARGADDAGPRATLAAHAVRPAAVALAVLTSLLAACTSLAPTYQRPAAPIPPTMPWPAATLPAASPAPVGAAASAPAAAATSPSASASVPVSSAAAPAAAPPNAAPPIAAEAAWDWRALVREPRQRQLVELALANNRDLRQAMLAVERARAVLGVTEADRLPTVGAGLSASRAPAAGTGKQTNTFNAGVSVSSWEIDFFGRIASLDDAAQAQLLASRAGQRSAELSLASAVLSADLALAADARLQAIAEAALTSRQATLDLTRLREKVGASSALELQAAESLVAQAEVARVQATRQRQLDLNALTLLLGAAVPAGLLPPGPTAAGTAVASAPGAASTGASGGASTGASAGAVPAAMAAPGLATMPSAADAPLPSDFAAVPAGLPSEVLLDRPDVAQAEQLLVAANANIGAARAAFWPRITLTGSAGLVSTQLGNLLEAGSLAWTVAGQALQTVFDNGRNNANLRVAEVNRDLAIAAYEKALQSAFREAADALAGLASLREQLLAQQRLREASARAAQLTELRARRGAASSFELLDAQRSLLAADQALVATRLAEAQNRVALFKAIGR